MWFVLIQLLGSRGGSADPYLQPASLLVDNNYVLTYVILLVVRRMRVSVSRVAAEGHDIYFLILRVQGAGKILCACTISRLADRQ